MEEEKVISCNQKKFDQEDRYLLLSGQKITSWKTEINQENSPETNKAATSEWEFSWQSKKPMCEYSMALKKNDTETLEKALTSTDAEKWKAAMGEELENLEKVELGI